MLLRFLFSKILVLLLLVFDWCLFALNCKLLLISGTYFMPTLLNNNTIDNTINNALQIVWHFLLKSLEVFISFGTILKISSTFFQSHFLCLFNLSTFFSKRRIKFFFQPKFWKVLLIMSFWLVYVFPFSSFKNFSVKNL